MSAQPLQAVSPRTECGLPQLAHHITAMNGIHNEDTTIRRWCHGWWNTQDTSHPDAGEDATVTSSPKRWTRKRFQKKSCFGSPPRASEFVKRTRWVCLAAVPCFGTQCVKRPNVMMSSLQTGSGPQPNSQHQLFLLEFMEVNVVATELVPPVCVALPCALVSASL